MSQLPFGGHILKTVLVSRTYTKSFFFFSSEDNQAPETFK